MKNMTINRIPLVEFPKAELKEIIDGLSVEKLASFLDVTDLKADTQSPKIKIMADWAKSLGCASVCVNPVEVDILPELLKGSSVNECYVIDFPLGKCDIETKAQMTSRTVKKSRELRGQGKGMIDLDMVINVGRFKSDPQYALEEINAVCEAADGEHVKVITRSSELTIKENYKIAEIVLESKAHFIKNSTGMDAYGALPEHIRIMRDVVGKNFGVKAAGGISDAMTAIRLFYAGAKESNLQEPSLFRLGTSGPLNILSSYKKIKESTEQALEKDLIPCSVCPYYFSEKLREELKKESNSVCQQCKFREYRK